MSASTTSTDQDVSPLFSLVDFALAVLRQWHGDGERGDIDGAHLQEMAVKAGVCREEQRTTPCGDLCPCGEFVGHGEVTECVPITSAVFALMRESQEKSHPVMPTDLTTSPSET